MSLVINAGLPGPSKGGPYVYAGGRTVRIASNRLIAYVWRGWLFERQEAADLEFKALIPTC